MFEAVGGVEVGKADLKVSVMRHTSRSEGVEGSVCMTWVRWSHVRQQTDIVGLDRERGLSELRFRGSDCGVQNLIFKGATKC